MLHFQTHISVPFNCPNCKQLILFCRDLQAETKAVLSGEYNRLKIHGCYTDRGEDYWDSNVFQLLESIGFEQGENFDRLRRKPQKFFINRPHFGITFRQAESDEGVLHEMIGLDGHEFPLLYTGELKLPPFVLVRPKNLVKTSKGIYRTAIFEKPVFPVFPRVLFEWKEIYELTFRSEDSYRLELFTEKVLVFIKKSGGKVLCYFPLRLEKNSEQSDIFCIQMNLVSENSMHTVFRQISIPSYADLDIRQRKI